MVNQEEADRDIQKLLDVPAAKRFLSIEPMLGDIRLGSRLQRSPSAAFEAGRVTADMPAWTRLGSTALDWVICGGESGPQARPMHPDWVRSLRDECAAAGVPFHFKQWGEWLPADGPRVGAAFGRVDLGDRGSWCWLDNDGSLHPRTPASNFARSVYGSYLVAHVGTKAAGRLLDGIEHNGAPS